MSVGSSGREPDRQATEAASAASSNWVREALGEGWVEIEPGIFQQVPRDEPAAPIRPAAREEVESLEEKLREALEALQVDTGESGNRRAGSL